jgi:hypothetical protein
MRTANTNERKIDVRYRREGSLLYRLVVRIARRTVNRFAKSVICRAHERGLVNSFVMHELAGIIDRSLWPEREPAHSDNDQADTRHE